MNPVLVCAVTQTIENIWTTDLKSASFIASPGGAIYIAAMSILSVMLLYGIYEAFMRNGGVRDVVMIMVKVAVCAFLIQNWATFFNDISTNGSFVLANSIHSEDFYRTIFDDLGVSSIKGAWSLLKVLSLSVDVIEAGQMIFYGLAIFIYWVGYYFLMALFTIFGLVLFAVGPLVISLYPSSMFGSFAKSYISGLLEWLTWPVIYAIFGLLASTMFNKTSILAPSSSSNDNVLTNLALLAVVGVAMFVIPWIARHVISASFTGAAAVVSSAGKAAMAAGLAVASGGAGAVAGGAGMMGGGATAGGGGAAASAGGGGGGGISAGSAQLTSGSTQHALGSGGGGPQGGPPSPTPSPSQSGGGSKPPGSSPSGTSGGGGSSPSSAPSVSGGSSSGSSSSSSDEESSAPPAEAPSGGSAGGSRGSRWNWGNAVAGGVIGYQQGFRGLAGTAARNHLKGVKPPLTPK